MFYFLPPWILNVIGTAVAKFSSDMIFHKLTTIFQKRNLLQSELIPPEKMEDSWRSVLPIKIDLIGRDHEIELLQTFAKDSNCFEKQENDFSWQTLYGNHAVGKTRLASCWLSELQKQNWVVGFLSPDFDKKNLFPKIKKNTAIVIDDADLHGEKVWDFINEAYNQWGNSKKKIRVLLLSHSEMTPSYENKGNKEIAKKIACLERIRQQKRNPALIDCPSASQNKRFRLSKTDINGLKLEALKSAKNQIEIFSNYAKKAGCNPSKEFEGRALKEAEGVPAFLALAGYYGENWKDKIEKYAGEIINGAEENFPEQEGVELLLFSTLLAKKKHSDWKKKISKYNKKELSYIYPLHRTRNDGNIVYEIKPDLLSHEVMIQACGRLLEIKKDQESVEDICRVICNSADGCPNHALSTITSVWRHKITSPQLRMKLMAYVCGDQINADSHGSAECLEILYSVISTNPNITVPSFDELNRIRTEFFIDALLTNPNEKIDIALKEISEVSVTSIFEIELLKTLNQSNQDISTSILETLKPLNKKDSFIEWILDMLDQSSLEQKSTLYSLENIKEWYRLLCWHENIDFSAIDDLKFTSDSLPDSLVDQFQSFEIDKCFFAAFRIIATQCNRKKQPSELIPEYKETLICLEKMLKSNCVLLQQMSALVCSQIAKEPNGSPGFQNFEGTDIIPEMVKMFKDDSITCSFLQETLALAFDKIFRKPIKKLAPLYWLEHPPETTEHTDCTLINSEVDKICSAIKGLLKKTNITDQNRKALVLACIRMNGFYPEIKEHIIAVLNSSFGSFKGLQDIFIYLKEMNNEAATDVLKAIAIDVKHQESLIYSLSALIALEKINVLEELLSDLSTIKFNDETISLVKLVNEMKDNKNNLRKQKNLDKLKKWLIHITIRNNTNLVHHVTGTEAGKSAIYLVAVEPEITAEYDEAVRGGSLDLRDYGYIIESFWGEKLTSEIKHDFNKKYDFGL